MWMNGCLYAWFCLEIATSILEFLERCSVASLWMPVWSLICDPLCIVALSWMAARIVSGTSFADVFARCLSSWAIFFFALHDVGCTSVNVVGSTLFGSSFWGVMKGNGLDSFLGRKRFCGVRYRHVLRRVPCFCRKAGCKDRKLLSW